MDTENIKVTQGMAVFEVSKDILTHRGQKAFEKPLVNKKKEEIGSVCVEISWGAEI